ncbi:hypothetical protein [Flexithrix dorotheae]|uniref:hypothetical protein n=1 Tax=Flexithrix dorotheae TaxID=70993 RepID=UPI00039F6D22|nr:hypothetical protein [Flexithrix dorotheae]
MKKFLESHNPCISHILLGILLMGLFFLRVNKLWETGVFDYDSAKNSIILTELNSGNFANLFHHASPGFYLIYLPIHSLFNNFLFLEYFTALLNLLAIWLLVLHFSRLFHFNSNMFLWLLAFVGSAVYQIVSSRYLAMEALSLLLFVLIFIHYHKSLVRPENNRYIIFAQIILSLGVGVNYKFILVILVFWGYEILFAKRKWNLKMLFTSAFIFVAPFVFYTFLGWLLGIGWDNYGKHFFVQAFIKDMNPNEEVSKFNLDLLYYVKYFLYFENPLSWIGIIVFLFAYQKKSWAIPLLKLSLFVVLAFFLGMSLLQKAPRALLFIFPLIYIIGFLGIFALPIKKWIKYGLITLGIALNIFLTNENVWKYSNSSYPELASVLKLKSPKKIISTAGLGVSPFLSPTTQLQIALTREEVKQYKASGGKYLLFDSYSQIINSQEFEEIKYNSTQILFEKEENSLASPYLFLEHSEYTGLNFEETLLLRKKAIENGLKIRLITFD